MSLTTDDLQSIKTIVDKSIKDNVEPMFEELNQILVGCFQETQDQINEVKTDVNELKNDVKVLKTDMTEVKHDLKYIKVAVHRLEVRGTLRT